MNANKAQEIIAKCRAVVGFGDHLSSNDQVFFARAEGYLAALEGPEVKMLLAALESIEAHCEGVAVDAGLKRIARQSLAAFHNAVKS